MRESIAVSHVALDYDAPEHYHAVGVVDFAMDEVVARLDGTQPPVAQPLELAGEGLRAILHMVWRTGKNGRARPIAAFHKFLALSAVVNPTLFNDLTLKQLGAEHGITRAALSKHAVSFSKELGLQFRRQHGGRDNMRKAALGNHNRARKAP